MNIDITRLNIDLQGIASQVIDEAMQGFEESLHQRLLTRRVSLPADYSIDELSLLPLRVSPQVDADSLRALIADRVIDAVLRDEEERGGEQAP